MPGELFAEEVAARLPTGWHALPPPQPRGGEEGLWDNGHVSWAVEQRGHSYPGYLLKGPNDETFQIIDRPCHPDQHLVAPLTPKGFHARHFHGVEEPHGIAVSDQPARAAARIAHRLLPRYYQALEAVMQRARAEPVPPMTPEAVHGQALTCVWNEAGDLIATDHTVPEQLHVLLYLKGFHHRPDLGAFVLPAAWGNRQAQLIHEVGRELGARGIGLTLRPASPPTPPPRASTPPAPVHRPRHR
ncbi:hypothetical protein ABZ820_04975 [Streptomyces diacarni]|uniref:hypothetical protein n=1 Tax=Streptomyces diacarni TaxID=2800381 RepID=UPI0033C4F966